MTKEAKILGTLVAAILFLTVRGADCQGRRETGEGVDSQLLWLNPGPSNFPTISSSDIAGHTEVVFSGMLGYYRKPISLKSDKTEWVVEDAFTADFLWAFGIVDVFQIGLALPVVLNQDGEGATPLMPQGANESDYALASSALKDIRGNVKVRFLGGGADIPDRRGLGLALDVGVALPSGDELNFAGDRGFVFFPTAIVDFHLCKLSAAINLGARLRTEKNRLSDLEVGQQGTAGAGITGHYFDRRLLLSLEGTGVAELDGFDRMGAEYRGGVGYVPDDEKALVIWLAGGSSSRHGALLGNPEVRILAGISYAPGAGKDRFLPQQ